MLQNSFPPPSWLFSWHVGHHKPSAPLNTHLKSNAPLIISEWKPSFLQRVLWKHEVKLQQNQTNPTSSTSPSWHARHHKPSAPFITSEPGASPLMLLQHTVEILQNKTNRSPLYPFSIPNLYLDPVPLADMWPITNQALLFTCTSCFFCNMLI